ncbi:hypothetical protein B0A48_07133 [Cryoendolithus antarcticus]|uniref:H-type lectin domain-containing protein n=1 Tax=Cryoendolithus antarcticus TaxID=1507870 RepID=A0A1V8T7P7_9PEZI|nr:hypothetical protein B0A48_07133 [Cryoendolithus antarcticus]
MGHLSDPGPDTGSFTIASVKDSSKDSDWKYSRAIALPESYSSPPTIGLGLNSIDCGAQPGDNIRIQADVSMINDKAFEVSVEKWNNSILNDATLVWTESAKGAKDTKIGSWSNKNRDQKQSGDITFDTPFEEPPTIVLWFKKLDLTGASNVTSWHVHTYATDITSKGFKVHIDTWGHNKIYSVNVTWIAIKKGKKNMHCGQFVEAGAVSKPQKEKEKRIEFPEGKFKNKPTVLSGLSMIDHPAKNPVKVASVVEVVSKEGFTWRMETGSEYACSADYIAIG